ncbi:hypothetical protein [Streptomyces spiralis]|uniref:hypothetical protein n=1 Tax=Streptomyces spiralis TaxID=66376 RepID=UPI00369D2D44
MHFEWKWLHSVIQVPYVPTIGSVHPDALAPSVFDDVIRVAGTGAFLAYDKDQRWAKAKDETVLPKHIEHTSTHTLIPTLSLRGGSTLTVYAYGPADEEAAALISKLAATDFGSSG